MPRICCCAASAVFPVPGGRKVLRTAISLSAGVSTQPPRAVALRCAKNWRASNVTTG